MHAMSSIIYYNKEALKNSQDFKQDGCPDMHVSRSTYQPKLSSVSRLILDHTNRQNAQGFKMLGSWLQV